MEKKKVVVGMSGGVDSSVAAYLLKQQGYDVMGVTMQIWQDEDHQTQEENGGCCGLSAVDDARRVAWSLDIPYYVMNFREEFKNHVIDYFVDEYVKGRTPNPCIACNRYVKWESLLHRSLDIGAEYIATGHYARIERENGRYLLKKALDTSKDQSYVLYMLTQAQLSHTQLPLGALHKTEVRAIAEEQGFYNAKKPDSQDICFVPDGDYATFIRRHTGKTDVPGDFTDESGKILGQHKGITHYTVGQRKGLGVPSNEPLYVKAIDPARNRVVLSGNAALYSRTLTAGDLNWIAWDTPPRQFQCSAKTRYRQTEQPCTVTVTAEGRAEVCFDMPQRAITPGQAVVFYEGDTVLGGGTIL